MEKSIKTNNGKWGIENAMKKYIKKIVYYVDIYFSILVQNIKCKMSYKEDFIISMFGIIITNIASFISFSVIFQNFSNINGWTLNEVLFLYGYSLMAVSPCQCIFENNWTLSTKVYNGEFIKYCFRPINIFFYYISEEFDLKGIGQFIFGLWILIRAIKTMKIDVTILFVVILILMLLASSLFMIAMLNISAAICFWVVHSRYLMLLVNKLKDYSRYPLTIYSSFFQFIFTMFIPIAFIAYYPSLIFLRQEKILIIAGITILFGAVWMFLSYKLWVFGAKKYSGTGS